MIKATVNGQTTVDVNIDDWTEGNKNPDGSKNKFKTPLKDLPRDGTFWTAVPRPTGMVPQCDR